MHDATPVIPRPVKLLLAWSVVFVVAVIAAGAVGGSGGALIIVFAVLGGLLLR